MTDVVKTTSVYGHETNPSSSRRNNYFCLSGAKEEVSWCSLRARKEVWEARWVNRRLEFNKGGNCQYWLLTMTTIGVTRTLTPGTMRTLQVRAGQERHQAGEEYFLFELIPTPLPFWRPF